MVIKKKGRPLTRRGLLQRAGGVIGAAAFPASPALVISRTHPSQEPPAKLNADVTGRLARYMVESRSRTLPPDVLREAKHRVLDTLAALVSGARLKPGEMAIEFVRRQGGVTEASVFTTDIRTSAVNAALANGMFAHADETDDFEPITKAHPGCSVVPAALAMAERDGRSGMELLSAVALGYDLCCRFLLALGPDLVRATHRSAEGTSATFGSAAAAASLARLDEQGMRYALSYAAQQVSGLWSWVGDGEHVEKAFDFAGMGARNGVTAAIMVQMGFSGVADVLDGEHNMLQALSTQPRPEEMVAGLGRRFFVAETAIKIFSVGYPIQAALDAFLTLRKEHGLNDSNVQRVLVRLPEDGARVVDDSAMPDVNLQYIIAVALVDGTVSFSDSHSRERMADPRIRQVKQRIQLVADRALMVPEAPRSGFVEVTLRDGRTVSHFTRHPPGTMENPLDTAAVSAKARELMVPVLGAARTEALIQRINALEQLGSVRDLRRCSRFEGPNVFRARSVVMRGVMAVLLSLAVSVLLVAQRMTLDIYVVDVEGGNATLFVAPSGESALIDSGNGGAAAARDADRIMAAVKDAGLTQIDNLITTHWHGDHFGGLAELASRIPIRNFIDHGPNVQPAAAADEFLQKVYPALYGKAKHTVAKPGDTIAIRGLDWRIVSAAGEALKTALPGAGKANPYCATFKPQEVDTTENAQSVGSVIAFGKFRAAHLGDLTWNKEFNLMCPNNRIGTVDLWIVSHHGQPISNSEVLAHAIQPRVAILNNGTRKGGQPEAMRIIHSAPGLEDLWQLHFSQLSGQEYTVPGMFIANVVDEPITSMPVAAMAAPPAGAAAPPPPVHNGTAYWIKVSAQTDGSFTVVNARNRFSKTYKARQ